MVPDLTNIDPDWAWQPYSPSKECPWSRRLAAHLYRRAAFAANWTELDRAVDEGPTVLLDRLCNPAPPDAASKDFARTIEMLAERIVAGGDTPQLAAWWVYRMLKTPDPLLEKLTLFWHGHFATSDAKVDSVELMRDQNELLRRYARGKFEDLVRGISRDPAMLIYLDSRTNRRIHPNENYARELMELFCLGHGNYTEKDIKQLARAFTGWEVQVGKFHFNESQHDTGEKSFLGSRGNFDGDDAVRIVLKQPAAPRFIARKLIRFFALDEPAATDALVEPIARELRERNFEIGPVVRRILGSNLFFSEHAVGRKVRSPVDLGVGLLRALGATTSTVKLAQGFAELGQSLFFPPNVKGWEGGRTWINSATILGRANLVRQTLLADETNFDSAGGSLDAAAKRAGATEPKQVVDWLCELLLAVAPPADAREVLVRMAAGGDGARADANARIRQTIQAMSVLPEFQLA